MTPNFKLALPALLLLALLLSATLSGCASQPTYLPIEAPRLPPLPAEARQPPIPSECLPTCSDALTTEQKSWLPTPIKPVSPASPASEVTTH